MLNTPKSNVSVRSVLTLSHTTASRIKSIITAGPHDTSTAEGRSHERLRRASLTSITSIGTRALTLITPLVAIPLMLHYLGAERYGIWLTLASGNQLAGFNPKTEQWEMVDLKAGINPHTLRFDKKGRIWFTLSATNHVGMFDPATKEQKFISLPAPDFKTRLILWATPFLIAHADWFNLKENSANANGVSMPVPYGIDISPIDGSVWYSQLYMRHIGRIDPETLEVTSIATPFDSPRRLRFDSKGNLWIPSYSEGSLHLFDTQKRQWVKSWTIPVEPAGSEVPYAVFVDKQKDEVWITGTQSDSIIRFNPATETWTHYPSPTQVTYTREMDMDDQHRIWASHASFPTWHIEGGLPKVFRVDPAGAPDIDASGVFNNATSAPTSPQAHK